MAGSEATAPVSEHLRNWLLPAAAVAGVTVSLWSGYSTASQNREQAERTRQTVVAERFSRSVEQLGSASPDVRLGSMYAMQRLAADDGSYQKQVQEILVAYLYAHELAGSTRTARGRYTKVNPDIVGALMILAAVKLDPPTTAIQRANSDREIGHYVFRGLGLQHADLMKRSLPGIDLAGASIERSRFDDADLPGADLRGTFLAHSSLSMANLAAADLYTADLSSANLVWAHLKGARLQKASLADSTLWHANLDDAHLENVYAPGVRMHGATLRGAHLMGAALGKADLTNTDLTGADLQHADLSDANLVGADLRGANISGTRLRGVTCDLLTRWPNDGTPPRGVTCADRVLTPPESQRP
ncbi:pentapeptide repeat-containing protein [Angustibacter luteus]|uniref:Pentapeptide repeat-containing protein n=1 Tax=Angustibacter luteus TaxID=658456 RepID=A0ABW1JD42_9ACTN